MQPDVEIYINSLTDNRIKLFRREHNSGLATALNFLLELVLKNPKFKLIARMDADDISMPDLFEKQFKFLIGKPDISVVGCWYEEIDDYGNHLNYRRLLTEHEALRKRYYSRTPFAHPSVMFRRELIEKAWYYPTDTILMEDNVLWGSALKCGFKFGNVPEYLLKFRIDRNFYKRRSGIMYRWNYIMTRFKISKSLNFSIYSRLDSFFIGKIKMMPSCILRFLYFGTCRY